MTRPAMLAAPAGKKWRQFTSDAHSAVGVTDDGAIYAMGSYNFNGTLTQTALPQAVPSGRPMDFSKRAVLTQGGLWVVDIWDTLIQLSGAAPELGSHGFIDVAAVDGANNQILALSKNGMLDPLPRTNNGAVLPWVKISTASAHSLGIDSQGQMFAWGDGARLPIQEVSYSDIPLRAAAPPGGGTWTKICAGNLMSMAVDSSGRLYGWGTRGYTGSTNYVARQPVAVDVPIEEIGWLDLSVGQNAAFALSARGNLYTWGFNREPKLVEGLPSLLDASSTVVYTTFEPVSAAFSDSFTVDLIGGTGSAKIETSADLIHWQAVTNLVTATGRARLALTANQSSNLFVRVRDLP